MRSSLNGWRILSAREPGSEYHTWPRSTDIGMVVNVTTARDTVGVKMHFNLLKHRNHLEELFLYIYNPKLLQYCIEHFASTDGAVKQNQHLPDFRQRMEA